MRARRLIGVVVVGSCFGACAPDAASTPDASAPAADATLDASPIGRDGSVDAAPDATVDVARVDAPATDRGADVGPEAGSPDVPALDAGARDVPVVDAGRPDAGAPDARVLDAVTPDAGAPDAGARDSGAPDVPAFDAGAADVPAFDAGAAPLLATLTAGTSHHCALRADGTARCWGSSTDGQLGAGTGGQTCGPFAEPCSRTPVAVSGLSAAVQIGAGGRHTCAALRDGTARCWGFNRFGQLGDGTVTSHTAARPVTGLAGAVQLAAGASHTCALLADGTVRCWGLNQSGQLGAASTASCDDAGTRRPCARAPVAVPGLAGVVRIAARGHHTCAMLRDGTVRCWGLNGYGQLGDGTTTNRPAPTAVPGLASVVDLAAGDLHTCAVLADGALRCWGFNNFGELGDGTRTNRPAPTAVTGLAGVATLAAGAYHTCAALRDGTARCWGLNSDLRLGATSADRCLDGTNTNQPCSRTPLTVEGLAGATGLAAGAYGTCARLADGAVRCWGSNRDGQLGVGPTTYGWTATPMPVTGLP